jgi:hypothetical protein
MRGILENSGSNDLRDAVRRDLLVEDCSKRIIELSDERALVGSGVIPQRLGPLHEHFVGIGSETFIVSSINSASGIALGSLLLPSRSVCTHVLVEAVAAGTQTEP